MSDAALSLITVVPITSSNFLFVISDIACVQDRPATTFPSDPACHAFGICRFRDKSVVMKESAGSGEDCRVRPLIL